MVAGSLTPRLFPHFLMMSRVSIKILFSPMAVIHKHKHAAHARQGGNPDERLAGTDLLNGVCI
ncbi:hypothetical protein F0726_01832 [Acidithiobacillus caldus]|nr:hypothetical protein F0726_01832 [Acidithiobacillus caldus]